MPPASTPSPAPTSLRAQLRRGLVSAGRIVAGVVILGIAALFFWQDHLLWHPRPYARGEVENFTRPLVPLAFRTPQGSQTAFYAPPRDGRATLPSALWVLFAGNGSLALDWDDFLRDNASPGNGFLLVDYPGFGRCEGKPSPASIRQNVDGALATLAPRLGQPDGAALLRAQAAEGHRLRVMGQSMGTGAALDFATRTPGVNRVILISPYTSLRDASRGTVGWPLCWLLVGNFDNRARLNELAARPAPPAVLIVHGDEDTLVPQAMGRALAAAHPGLVRFVSVAGAGHDDTAYVAKEEILAALAAE